MPSTAARVIYPELPDPLTPGDVQRLFSPSYSERGWAPTIARRPESQVALLVHLKIFQTIGRFLPAAQIPPIVVERVALKMGARCANPMVGTKRTLHRYRAAILQHLGVASWLGNGRGIALEAMQAAARMRVDPADIINAAIEALVQHRIELPPLAVLRRLAGTAHNQINRAQWAAVSHRLPVVQRDALDALLVVDAKTQKSAFSVLCTHPGRPSRKNLDALVERYEWLMQLPDPAPALRDVADAKVMLWANEARRLNALELRGYVSTRRHVLLLASIRAARGQVLDELTHMLLRLARKIEHRSQQLLAEWYQARHGRTDQLIRALRDALIAHDRALDAPEKVAQMEAVFVSHGGHESLVKDCDAHLRHERQNWRPFARAVFVPFRVTLLRLARLLPMHTARACGDVLLLVSAITDGINTPAYLSIEGVPPRTVPREWGALVHDHPNDPLTFNRRQLEVVAVLELASAIRAGEVFVLGSQSFDRFWDRVPIEATTPAAIEAYAASHGWDGGAEGFVRILKRNLDQQAMFLDRAVGSGDQAYLQRGRHGRPVVARLSAVGTPETAIALEEDLMAQMPERPVLEALSNTEHWAKWGRHFGPPSRQGPQLREAHRRYVFTAFAYGCGLGPTEAARHLSAAVSADQLAFADRRHIDITDLRAASADLVNLYARFELPQQWGGGASAAADGTHFETHEDNLLAEQHIRYGKTGGIAYRHVADNYIALFSRLIACGTYEDRGRDARYRTPPAQIPACATNALGSYLGCLTAKRSLGHG